MNIKNFQKEMKEKFSEKIIYTEIINVKRLMIYIKPSALLEIANYLFNDLKYRYVIESAMDSKNGYEIIYHFSDDNSGWIFNLNAIISREKPEIESLTQIVKGAEWIEREIFDLLGIKFLHHPNLKRFLFAESWPENEFPFRRENDWESKK